MFTPTTILREAMATLDINPLNPAEVLLWIVISTIILVLIAILITQIKGLIKLFYKLHPNFSIEDEIAKILEQIITKLKSWFDKMF